MKSTSHTGNHKEERPSSTSNRRVFKLSTTLPKRIAALQQSLTSPIANITNTSRATTTSPLVSPYVMSLANTMKLRMKAAVNTMVWNGNRHINLPSSTVSPPTATDTVTTTPQSLCDLQQQKHQLGGHQEQGTTSTTLKNSILLKQYLTFVQEETGAILDMDLSPSPKSSAVAYQPSFETQQNRQSHSLASSGAALIESIVHHSPSKFDPQHLSGKMSTTKVLSTKRVSPRRRSRRAIKSTSLSAVMKLEEEYMRLKKAERLRLKGQRKSRWTPLKRTTMISNKSKKRHATPPAVIRCICATPHEEFGAMVQCDDCTCWLHLECLALDEDALEETFRCPSCSISLGPGQHLTSSVTWRVAAQLNSQRLANRRNTTAETSTTSNHKGGRKDKHRSHRRGYDRQQLQHGSLSRYRHQRQQRKKRQYRNEAQRRHQPLYSAQDTATCSSSDSDDNANEHQQNQTWMIPKMTIHSSIDTAMTTSNGNVLVQKLKNHRSTSTTTSQQNLFRNNDGDDTDVDTDMADSDTTESDWESGDMYRRYQHYRSSIYDDDMPNTTSTRASLSSINTSPSLTLSSSHTGSDIESPCEATTPTEEHFDHDGTYMKAMMASNNSNITTNYDIHPRLMLSTTATSACLDQESLVWLSRLAYLEKLQSSTGQQCFSPHASDVFLCGDQQQQKYQPTISMMLGQEVNDDSDTNDHHGASQSPRVPLVSATTAIRSDPPSTICSHDLSQFSFDAGPFWSPIQ